MIQYLCLEGRRRQGGHPRGPDDGGHGQRPGAAHPAVPGGARAAREARARRTTTSASLVNLRNLKDFRSIGFRGSAVCAVDRTGSLSPNRRPFVTFGLDTQTGTTVRSDHRIQFRPLRGEHICVESYAVYGGAFAPRCFWFREPASAQSGDCQVSSATRRAAVMPGVLVEASSPALIETTRSVVTDGCRPMQDRRPRPRAPTRSSFTLAGFKIVQPRQHRRWKATSRRR